MDAVSSIMDVSCVGIGGTGDYHSSRTSVVDSLSDIVDERFSGLSPEFDVTFESVTGSRRGEPTGMLDFSDNITISGNKQSTKAGGGEGMTFRSISEVFAKSNFINVEEKAAVRSDAGCIGNKSLDDEEGSSEYDNLNASQDDADLERTLVGMEQEVIELLEAHEARSPKSSSVLKGVDANVFTVSARARASPAKDILPVASQVRTPPRLTPLSPSSGSWLNSSQDYLQQRSPTDTLVGVPAVIYPGTSSTTDHSSKTSLSAVEDLWSRLDPATAVYRTNNPFGVVSVPQTDSASASWSYQTSPIIDQASYTRGSVSRITSPTSQRGPYNADIVGASGSGRQPENIVIPIDHVAVVKNNGGIGTGASQQRAEAMPSLTPIPVFHMRTVTPSAGLKLHHGGGWSAGGTESQMRRGGSGTPTGVGIRSPNSTTSYRSPENFVAERSTNGVPAVNRTVNEGSTSAPNGSVRRFQNEPNGFVIDANLETVGGQDLHDHSALRGGWSSGGPNTQFSSENMRLRKPASVVVTTTKL